MAPRPPRLWRHCAAVLLLLAAGGSLACAHPRVTGATGPGPAPEVAPASAHAAPQAPVLAREPARPAPGIAADRPPLPEPEVALPEISALSLARQVLEERAPHFEAPMREAVARVLADAEQHHGIEVLLSLALITQESRFDSRARGPRGSLGLMQLRPFVARDVARRHQLPWQGERTLYDPAHNVRLGTLYFAEMLAMFGDVDRALAAYNMGPYRLRRLLRRAAAPTRFRYPERVRDHYEELAERYAAPAAAAWGG